MALTAGTWQLTAQCQISGVKKAPQGTATVASIPSPGWSGGGSDTQTLSYGTASGSSDIFCCAAWTIVGSGTKNFDLFTAGTDFPDVFGNAAIFAKLKSVFVEVVNGTGGAAGAIIGGAATNANKMWFGNQNDTWAVTDGGPPFIGGSPAGITVDATHKDILFTNATSTSITLLIALAGSSA